VKIINLNLLEHTKEPKANIFISEAISKNNLIVILGSPGSGKTSILKKYSKTNEKAQFLKIKRFIKLDNQVKDDTAVLLLDGLDEYRSVSTDKKFVIEELADKLKPLDDIKIVISCREMDWYGESDESALKDVLDSGAVVFSVQLLNPVQQIEMARIYGIDNPESFIDKFSSYGFLDNPQMFKMIAELYKEKSEINFNSKAELYEAFIRGAKEKNEENKRNKNQLTSDEILKYSGYLAFFYMFTDVESFEDDFVDNICDNDKGFSKERLTQVLNTSLFDHKIFIHRTIAEFALAHFLVNEKMTYEDSLANERIKALFVKIGKIPTEVRGVYAWLCSLHGDMSFIDVDPYYQAVYGDNSLFTETQKKEIVLSVKNYAEEHPWFIDFWAIHNQVDSLGLLYMNNLDDFYIKQLEESKFMKSHYLSFIVSILNTSDVLSEKMKKYLKEKVFDIDTPTYIKDDILKVFSEDLEFLLEVLNSIKNAEIEDNENEVKEFLLNKLYPNIITPNKIIDYLKLYNEPEHLTVGDAMYLFRTKYQDKFELAKSLLRLNNEEISKRDKNEHTFYGSDFMDDFVSDYLYETILKYPIELNTSQVYDIIVELKNEVEKYTHLEFEPYSLVRKNDKTENEEKFRKLSDELYSLHLDKAIGNSIDDIENIKDVIFDYNYLFPYSPNNIFNILLNKIKLVDDVKIKKELFSWALTYIPFGYDDNFDNYVDEVSQLKKISDEYGFEEILSFRLSKELPKWKEKQENRKSQKENERKKILEKNEAYFFKRTDEEILTNFGDLKYISDLIYMGNEVKDKSKYLTRTTFGKLKMILKELIFNNSIDKPLTTVDSLSMLTERRRYIEQVYYTSLALNNFQDDNLFKQIDSDMLAYLYIVDLMHNAINIVETNYSEYFEKENTDSVVKILKQYIQLLIKEHYDDLEVVYADFISNEKSLEKLKRIAFSRQRSTRTLQETLLNVILSAYAFDISIDKLKEIKSTIPEEDNNNMVLSALVCLHEDKKDQFTKHMASELHDLFRDGSLFDNIETKWRIKILDYMFTAFDTEKSIEFVGGGQSSQSLCATFLTRVINTLSITELKSLYLLHNNEYNIWRNRILNEIDTKEQQDADQSFDRYPTSKLKEFILADTILSKEDFFEDIGIKLIQIKQEIEDNRNNEKNQFYNEDTSSKNEESCRDVILQKLNDKYGYDIESTKEKYEADNRVDINIKYKVNASYEVQVECKKDKNRDLYKGIENQLIGKYFSSDVEYGIYMIFYFGDKKDKKRMLSNIDESFTEEYKDRIKTICIDLIK